MRKKLPDDELRRRRIERQREYRRKNRDKLNAQERERRRLKPRNYSSDYYKKRWQRQKAKVAAMSEEELLEYKAQRSDIDKRKYEKDPKAGLRHMQKRVAMGKCWSCSQDTMPTSNSFCEKHWFAAMARWALGSGTIDNGNRLHEKLKSQEYRCPYSGVLLVPGDNCSLDHVLPKCRYPERAKDIDNLQWVLTDVNHAKAHMTHEEFVTMCCVVADRHNGGDSVFGLKIPVTGRRKAKKKLNG